MICKVAPFLQRWRLMSAAAKPQLLSAVGVTTADRYGKSATLTSMRVNLLNFINCVIYPSHNYDLPLLGIRLLSLSKKKILVLLDFGPLFRRDEAYIAKYVLAAYLDLVDRAEPVTSGAKLDNILQAQQLYLRYRPEKDQARRMFKRFYGQEWTQEYIHGFLFDWEQKLAQLVSNKN